MNPPDPDSIDPRVTTPPPPPSPEVDVSGRLDGVVIPTWAGDVHLAKACVASIRESMGEIPITLLVDGEVDTSDFSRVANVSRLGLAEVVPPEHLHLLTGSSLAKLPLFWASPYERFLCMDADALAWGDLRVHADLERFDFICAENVSGPWRIDSEANLARHAFDLGPVQQEDPAVRWEGERFAIMGVFMARRGVFARDHLMRLATMNCWRCYEQGLLNYLVWQARRDGYPRAGARAFQVFPAEPSMAPADRFIPNGWQEPLAVHFLGKKPRLGRSYRMIDDYRKRFLRLSGQRGVPGVRLLLEDLGGQLGRHRRSIARRLR
jgi:hypothetical protein